MQELVREIAEDGLDRDALRERRQELAETRRRRAAEDAQAELTRTSGAASPECQRPKPFVVDSAPRTGASASRCRSAPITSPDTGQVIAALEQMIAELRQEQEAAEAS